MNAAAAQIVGHQAAKDYFFGDKPPAHQAFLLSGIDGIGKSHFAWQLAAHWLGCQASVLQEGLHPDFLRLTDQDGKRIRITPIRDTLTHLQLTPVGEHRVLLIDPADTLGSEAANALLKFIEEPPEDAYVLLVSAQEDRLPMTIRSRCLPVHLSPLTSKEESQVWQNAGFDADIGQQYPLLYRLTQGRPALFASLYRQDCHEFLQELQDFMQTLPAADPERLHKLTDALTRTQYDCLCQWIANLFVQSWTEPGQSVDFFTRIPPHTRLKFWEKCHQYLRAGTWVEGTGVNFSKSAYFVLHSLSFFSKKQR